MSPYEWSADDLDSGGNWDSRILGSIATNLTQLRTWDQAIKELVQNADDAKATEISFSISDSGLTVYNDQLMTYCQFPNESYKSCNYEGENKNDFCDVHAIKTLSSQNKKKNSDATGKFGIGFVSTFLFTDQPSISSGGLRMTFLPAENRIPVKLVEDQEDGTNLYLPWATNPDSQVRIGLEKPAIDLEQIPGIVSEIIASCIRSFIFVRHLRHMKVLVNSATKLHLSREKNQDEITITDVLHAKSTSWLLLTSDSESESKLEDIRKSDRNFESRRVEFEILVPKEVDDNFSGLLYATLATNQRTYLPFHINADFYPDTSRNNLSFKDRGNERDPAALWNRSVIAQCAKFVATKIPHLHDIAGNRIVWKMLEGSYAIAKQKTGEIVPECFNDFWFESKKVARLTRLIEDQNNKFCLPTEVSLLLPHNKKHVTVMDALNLSFQKETDAVYLDICREIGSTVVGQSILAQALAESFQSGNLSSFLKIPNIVDCLYSLIEKALQYEHILESELQELPIWLTSRRDFVTFESFNRLPRDLNDEVFFNFFPGLTLSSRDLEEFPSLQDFVRPITGDLLISFLKNEDNQKSFLNCKQFAEGSVSAFDFLVSCITTSALTEISINHLREIGIWPHSNGNYLSLANSTLPGSFVDPIGVGQLLDRARLGEIASSFLARNLKVKELSLEVYVLDLLPIFFSTGELNVTQAQKLTVQFVDHQDDLNEQMIRKLQSFPFILAPGPKVLIPTGVLYPNESLQKLCSSQHFGFVDLQLLESLEFAKDKKLESFLRKIGVVFEPSFELLVSSWRFMQQDIENRDSEIPRLSDITESFLDIWQKKARNTRITEGVPPTHTLLWPCKNGCQAWHPASELIQSKWSKVICDVENLHEVGVNFGKRSRESIEEVFGIINKPEAHKVNQHLEHCIVEVRHPGDSFYRFLNWLSEQGDVSEKNQVELMRDFPLFFQEGSFWIPQDIYSSIPKNLEFLANFVHYVEKAPKGLESLWSCLGIGAVSERDVPRYFPNIKGEIISSSREKLDLSKYLSALSIVGTAFEAGELWAQNFLDEFKQSEFLLTVSGAWIQPEFGVIADNDDWADALTRYFASNLVRIEVAAYEFLIAGGARRLTDALEVHEESLSIDGDPDVALTKDFHIRSEEIYSLLANQIIDSPGGSMHAYESAIPRLDRMRRLTIHPVADIQVRVSLSINESTQSIEISNAPPLYLTSSNAVIYVKNNKEPILSIFSAILFEFIPRLSSDKILDSASKFLMVMKMDQQGLMNWLQTNRYLKNDITPPLNVDLTPAVIDIRNREQFEDDITDDMDSEHDIEPPLDAEEYSVDDRQENQPNKTNVSISLESDSEPRRNLPNTNNEDPQGDSTKRKSPNSLADKKDLKDFIRKSGSSSAKETEDSNSEEGQAGTSRQNADSSSRRNSHSGKRRRSGYAHAEAESGDGLGNVHNAEVDKAGVEWVKSKEWEIGRTVIDMNETTKNHEGFDLMSISDSNPNDIRYVEVKSCSGYWPDLGVGLSRKQFETAILEGYQSWLYVVENVMEQDSMKRLHRIQNPWENIRSVYFDPGWRDIAEVSAQQNPISLVKGLRIRHQSDGLGWIATEPTRQGQSIHCRILFDNGSIEKPVRWDDRFFEVVTGDDDDNS
jgi:hypothetical protein